MASVAQAPAKPLYASKTAVVNAVIALVPLYPPAALWVAHNAQTTLLAIGAINILLRIVTHGKITLFGGSAS